MPGVGLWSPGACCCPGEPPIPCSPCALPTSGTMQAYWRQILLALAGTSPCTVCQDDEHLEDMIFDPGFPPLGTGYKAGYWYTDCFPTEVWAGAAEPPYAYTSCVKILDAFTRIYLVCTTGGTLKFVIRSWFDEPNCEAESGAILGSLSNGGFWTESDCDPFSVRYTGNASFPCPDNLGIDVWFQHTP